VEGAASSPTLSHATPTGHISKSSVHHGAAQEAAKLGREALGNAADVKPISLRFFMIH
jgi:DNA topoisomerase 2-associated protein PAT1